jgi:hypothetical protein
MDYGWVELEAFASILVGENASTCLSEFSWTRAIFAIVLCPLKHFVTVQTAYCIGPVPRQLLILDVVGTNELITTITLGPI